MSDFADRAIDRISAEEAAIASYLRSLQYKRRRERQDWACICLVDGDPVAVFGTHHADVVLKHSVMDDDPDTWMTVQRQPDGRWMVRRKSPDMSQEEAEQLLGQWTPGSTT
jgi:hypothetical protein